MSETSENAWPFIGATSVVLFLGPVLLAASPSTYDLAGRESPSLSPYAYSMLLTIGVILLMLPIFLKHHFPDGFYAPWEDPPTVPGSAPSQSLGDPNMN